MQDSGTVSGLNFFFNEKSPSAAGSSFSWSSASHRGWVKSPVPITVTPFNCDHRQSPPGDMSGLVAREYFECTWKSAIYFMVDYKEYGTEMKTKD